MLHSFRLELRESQSITAFASQQTADIGLCAKPPPAQMEELQGQSGLVASLKKGGGPHQDARYKTGRGIPFMNTNNRQPMNNNNRRRGRNNNTNNRPQNNNNRSGFDYLNQIDNKARGNASQMLEKYKKLASDAQLNGDRVTAESYLQFADHYFRVLADFRGRQEARQGENQNRQREDSRDDGPRDEAGREDGNGGVGRDDWRDGGYTEQDMPQSSNNGDPETSNAETSNAQTSNDGERDEPAARQPRNNDRGPRPERSERNERPARGANRTPRRHHSEEAADEGVLDLAVLPPSIAMAISADEDIAEEAKTARKPRARRPKSVNDEAVVTAAE